MLGTNDAESLFLDVRAIHTHTDTPLYIYIYRYIYTYIYTHVYIYIYIYTYIFIYIHIYVYVYRKKHTYVHMHAYISTCGINLLASILIYLYVDDRPPSMNKAEQIHHDVLTLVL